LADLAVSFPALLYALATSRSAFDSGETVNGVIRGEKLSHLARLAGIPLWLRKFSPEALAESIETLPDGDKFRRNVGNYIPRSPKLGRIWLRAVGRAYALADEPFALWIAREVSRNASRVEMDRLRLVGIWAWYSTNVPSEVTKACSEKWHDATNFTNALAASVAWRQALALDLSLGENPVQDMWLSPADLHGYEFVPLSSSRDILEEAVAMKNCLRTYGGRVARNRCRLWSLRKDGARAATSELALRHPDPCPRIVQLKTPNGDHAPAEIWWVAHAWVGSHDLAGINTTPASGQKWIIDQQRWVSLWRPYWLAKRRIPPWLPLSPSPRCLLEL
jgi:hypothetical protein